MRFANLAGRLVVLHGERAVDVGAASSLFDRWDVLTSTDWSRHEAGPVDPALLGPPIVSPRQIFAVGLNYGARADEGGLPDQTPVVFTKFASCLTGAHAVIDLPTPTVDWEIELVAVMGERGQVAGFMVGQDLTERREQFRGAVPQFSLAKSHPGFGPTGPWLVTPDELDDADDLELICAVNGEVVQQARTSELIVPVPALVARLSAQLTLLPGDLIFTGTPGGVGHHRNPPRYLAPGDVLTSSITGLGTQSVTFR
jgi:2,4-diketo-3-deoxy-L-fuconate hydrolase